MPFIIPPTNDNIFQLRETAFNIIDEVEILAQERGVQRIEDSLYRIGVQSLGPSIPDSENPGSRFPTRNNVFGNKFIGGITLCPGGQNYINVNNLGGPTIPLQEVNVNLCLFTINNQKSIIRTPTIGRDGTFKTYMNKGDYDITIDMLLIAPDDPSEFQGVNYNGVYPYSIVNNIIEICEAPCPVTIASDFLNIFGITNIVIDDYEISQEEGQYSQQKITIKAYSDFSETYKSIINY